MGTPPLEDGAVKATVAWVLPDVAAPIVGAPGVVETIGVTVFDEEEAGPVPYAFVAVMVKV